VIQAEVNASAHLLQAVKEFVGHLDGEKKKSHQFAALMSWLTVLHDLKQY
jgi:hypothetical protein